MREANTGGVKGKVPGVGETGEGSRKGDVRGGKGREEAGEGALALHT